MTEFGKIDDPVDASYSAWPEEPGGIAQKSTELSLTFGGLAFGPAKVLKILRDQFASSNRFARVIYLLDGFRLGLKALQAENASDRERLNTLEQRLGTPQFAAAISTGCEEAIRATSEKKIQQLAAVLVGAIAGSAWADPAEDLAALIRDIAQLGDRDLKVLRILAQTHASAIKSAPDLYEPDAFSRETAALMRDVRESGSHSDDFLSTCERLRGFGLAADVLRNIAHMAPHDYCYRPTRRGLAILEYLVATRNEGQENAQGKEQK
jgi:hypothetical protein